MQAQFARAFADMFFRSTDQRSVDSFFAVRKLLKINGERGRNRTFNLLIKSQLLCQLSYAPRLWMIPLPRTPDRLVQEGIRESGSQTADRAEGDGDQAQ